MQKKKYKNTINDKRAILHMIGQAVIVFGQPVTIADIAGWMHVCKRTATKYLKRMEHDGYIVMDKVPYRQTWMYAISLSPHGKMLQENGYFVMEYRDYAQKVMGVILQ